MIQRSSELTVEYITSHQLFETQRIKLKIGNDFGRVEDVKVFFNKYGQFPGEDGCYDMIYNSQESDGETSVFVAQFQHRTAGYRTFVIALQVNGRRRYVKRNAETDEAVLTAFAEDEYAFWESMPYCLKYDTPDSGLEGGIMYQIFPDTFFRKDLPKEYENKVVSWDTDPKWKPDEDGEYRNNQYYGGTIQGIIAKLPHIKSLGVTALYLCPITKGGSQNRYDTIDYEMVDPMLGTWDDVDELHEKCNSMGISLGIDIVINHSSYLNSLVKEKPHLYKWKKWLEEAECWWDFKPLYLFNQDNQEYQDVYVPKFVKAAATHCDFLRFDVTDSLSNTTIANAKSVIPDKNMLAEIWKNAITGDHRPFLEGEMVDCVMNYQFPHAIYRYVRWGKAEYFRRLVTSVYKLYPERALRRSPIFMSSHDIPRVKNILTDPYMKEDESFENVWDMEKSPEWYDENGKFKTYDFRVYEMANYRITGVQNVLAENLRRIAVFLQYTMPGLPSIFAGEELGATGLKDPTNRRPMPWDNIDQTSLDFYRNMGIFRNDHKEVFANGDWELLECDFEKLVYRRGEILFAVNRTENDIVLPEVLRNKNIIFSMAYGNNGCEGEIKNGCLPAYGVVAVKN